MVGSQDFKQAPPQTCRVAGKLVFAADSSKTVAE